MNYVDSTVNFLFQNSVWKRLKSTVATSNKNTPDNSVSKVESIAPNIRDVCCRTNLTGGIFVKLAGVYGATAVAMGAYGAHAFYTKKDIPDELKEVYKTANYYHFLHTMVLLAVPLVRRPQLVGTLIAIGMTIFCGTCYAYALTGHKQIRTLTPYGGTLLIIGWLAMVL